MTLLSWLIVTTVAYFAGVWVLLKYVRVNNIEEDCGNPDCEECR